MKYTFLALLLFSNFAMATELMNCTAIKKVVVDGKVAEEATEIAGTLTLDGDDMGPGDYDYIADLTFTEQNVSQTYILVGEEKIYPAGTVNKDELRVLTLRTEALGQRKVAMRILNRTAGEFILDGISQSLRCEIK